MPARLRGDPGSVRQVLTNLISNAIKFTKEGEIAVRVTVEAEAEANVLVRLEIKDPGIGIPLETQARLFQPFVQADSSTSRRFGGTGLGLAICKRLAESMDGSIGLESTPSRGSTFWVTMRFSRVAEATGETSSTFFHGVAEVLPHPAIVTDSSQPEPMRKESVLLAEDNPVNQQVALGNLRKLGYDADVAANGFEALEATARKRYDIILMDCQMPEMDGYEATREIRQREGKGRHAYIIAVTANAMVGAREKCLAAGMDDYVSKPLNRDELRAALLRGKSKETMPGNENAVRDLITADDHDVAQWGVLFAATAPSCIADMKSAHAESRAGDLSVAAHSLKGSCSNFGAAVLVELCAQIEYAANEGNLDGMGDLIASAERELDDVIGALKNRLKLYHL